MLADDVRAELASIEPQAECDRRAELSGLFHTAGSFHLRAHGDVSVHLDLATSAIARRAFSLLRALGVAAEIRTYTQRAFARPTRYQLHVAGSDRAFEVLEQAGILSRTHAPLERPPKRVVGRACCRRAYLRGALLGGGSVSGPRDPHLEVRTTSAEGADFVAMLAAYEDVPLRVIDRGRHAAAYAKSAAAVADLLALAGASEVALTIDEHAVVGDARARANRIANADHANIVRTSRAAHAQIRAIRALEASGTLEQLPAELREAAELRLRHPAASLRELAARCRPPATKAAAHRRLARLVRIAENRHQGSLQLM